MLGVFIIIKNGEEAPDKAEWKKRQVNSAIRQILRL